MAALFGGAISPTVAGLLVRWDLKAIYTVDAAIFVLPRRRPRVGRGAGRVPPRRGVVAGG